jgi:hypothetical protein
VAVQFWLLRRRFPFSRSRPRVGGPCEITGQCAMAHERQTQAKYLNLKLDNADQNQNYRPQTCAQQYPNNRAARSST